MFREKQVCILEVTNMERIVNGTPHVPIEAAAQELKTTHLKILMLLKSKALSGCQSEGEWLVERSSLDCLKLHGIEPMKTSGCATSCKTSACGCKGQ
jgi:hypothetical protein